MSVPDRTNAPKTYRTEQAVLNSGFDETYQIPVVLLAGEHNGQLYRVQLDGSGNLQTSDGATKAANRLRVSGTYTIFSDNYISGSSSTSTFLVSSGTRQTISSNIFNITAASPAISVTSSDCVVSDNNIADCAIGIDQTGVGGNYSMTGNYIKASSIGIRTAGAGNVITGNRIQQGSAGTGTGVSLLAGSDYTVVSGCRIGHAGNNGFATGILVAATVAKAVLTGNSLTGNTATVTDGGTGTINANNGL